MVRAPCCEKMGLKRGPWTREEDQQLIDYVTLYGHGNWRALPKQAGLLRCGKSCRLRWTNYLRPDIKRGNFTREEEDTIINLHGFLGNRWSAIAARLPGRTDNEIKNVWHTHLKKRLKHLDVIPESKQIPIKMPKLEHKNITKEEEEDKDDDDDQERESKANFTGEKSYNQHINSPQHSSSTTDTSSIVTTTTSDSDNTCMEGELITDYFPELDENFWSEVFSTTTGTETSNFLAAHGHGDTQIQFQNVPLYGNESGCGYNISNVHDGMDFWYDIFTRAGELPKLPEFL